MPMFKKELIQKLLSESIPGVNFKFQFYAVVRYQNHAIGVTDKTLYLLRLSLFKGKPKDVTEIPLSDIQNINATQQGIYLTFILKTPNKKIKFTINKMIGYDPREEAAQAFDFIDQIRSTGGYSPDLNTQFR